MSSETITHNELHVVMFPYLRFGHISPFVQLSNKLFSHGIQISFLSPSYNIALNLQSQPCHPNHSSKLPK
ncbi:unnamed protein product [Lathyrus oleraceus]